MPTTRWWMRASSIGTLLLGDWTYALAANGPETALDILKKRYARGEISKQEFDEIRQDLSEGD